MEERIAVVGLGYVGLPVAVGMARAWGRPGEGRVTGFDIDTRRIDELGRGLDATGELPAAELHGLALTFSADPAALDGASFVIVTVPTPIDDNRQPDLGPLARACAMLGPRLRQGAVVVFESTVYPGVTEEVCGPWLEAASGLRAGEGFHLGYSPERINPGDRRHRLETITKVVAGEDAATLERVAHVYGGVVAAGLHRAPSIKVAEAAKVIENTQRDLNIAFMNELSLIFDRLGIRTQDVLAAAGTKWNFLPFTPGLVGGHCIGVDPYYLAARAESAGYHPQVIMAGRRINDGMGAFIAQKLVKLLARAEVPLGSARVAVLGLTFKEDVPDLRNSRVPDIIRELSEFGVAVQVHDPLADAAAARTAYGLELTPLEALRDLDALILAVPHRPYREAAAALPTLLRPHGILIDVKAVLDPAALPPTLTCWSL